LLLVGETSGRIQLFELKNKFVLRQYGEHSNRINCLDFSPDNRHFISCANETAIKLWDIQNSNTESELTIAAAHSDNIKRVSYLSEHTILSASSDSTVKLWDLRNTASPVSTLRLQNPVEDFCMRGDNQLVISHGNSLSIATISPEGILEEQSSFFPFQKPATRVRYDACRDRVIAGGLDGHLKFFNISDSHEVSVAYKIKLPSEIFALDFSGDGNHFAMGLADGSLVIKSRMLETKEEMRTDEQKMMDQFEPTMISTSKNYKYFFRG